MSVLSRRLFLLRHAQAGHPAAVLDHERPLTLKGLEDAAALGVYLAESGLLPAQALVSTAVRTRSTWEQVQKALPQLVPALFDRRLYESSTDNILSAIRTISDEYASLIVVGHNPGLHQLALLLTGNAACNTLARLHAGYPPGSLAVLDFDVASWADIAELGASLERFITSVGPLDELADPDI